MQIQFFNRFYPSEHFDITIFGITLFEFSVDKHYGEISVVLTLIGLKIQTVFKKREHH